MDIVMTGTAGDLGTAYLARYFENQLLKRLPASFVEKAKRMPEKETLETAVLCSEPIGTGGIFGALWRLGEAAGTGLYVELSRIPVRQDTIEICEILDVTPYQLLSSGTLFFVENGNWTEGTIIGRTDGNKGRVVAGAEGIRYLTKPQPDELERLGILGERSSG
ncbi:hypothetical protein [Hominifimenecus sp. rT4P-3]|uniref:hypothetical protein n=1 Tax=Hominifimenecus sp. rT4P-3 TaxID=3242979 RepID=UPI003DA57FD9